ncbi:hypothetical protein Q8F55_008074 [Vanrija albida]|uniref:RlpA-like protein double-psi beta-barrel domain-containing protein n=1 Tax=Vanrija albida TaxID=181172 RepID=A0ABR3PVA6_9TREE
MLLPTLLLATLAAAAPIQQRWASKLEAYDTYHVRYLALGCNKQHDTQFFTDCCHPLKAGVELSTRPEYCAPNATALASASARLAQSSTAALPSASASAADDEDDDVYCSDAAPANSAAPSASAAISTPLNYAPSPVPTTSDAAPTTTAAAASSTTEEAASSSIDNNAAFGIALPSSSASSAAATTSSAEPTTTQAPSSPSPAPESSTTTTTTQEAQTTSSAAPPPPTGGSGGQVYSNAFATFFYQNGNAGACGQVHADSDSVVAIDTSGWWQNTGQVSDLCGKQVLITRVSDGRQVTATIADACPTCNTDNSLDLSVGAFNQIASPEEGMVGITWQFL